MSQLTDDAAALDRTADAADWLAGLADTDDQTNGGTNGPRIHAEATVLRNYAALLRSVDPG